MLFSEMHDALYNAARDNLRAVGWRMSPAAFDDMRIEVETSSNGLIWGSTQEISKAMGLPIEITSEIDGWELQTQRKEP